MSLTPAEIQARKSRIGASDVASIFGIPTFKGRNAYSTWLDKTDQLEPQKETAAMTAGNRLEPVLLAYAEDQFGKLDRNVVVFDPAGSPIASTLDGRVIADGRPVECKTSGIEGPIHGTWGEGGSDDVPDGYIIQCQTQILCTGASVCELVALLGGRGFAEFRIEPLDGLIAQIRAVTTDFWERYVVPRRDPRGDWADRLRTAHGVELTADPCEPALETVKRFRKTPKKTIDFDSDAQVNAVLRWREANAARLEAEKVEKAAQAEVLAGLGDAEAAIIPGGQILTHFLQNGAPIIDREAMKAAGIYEQYATPNSYRVLRLKKGK